MEKTASTSTSLAKVNGVESPSFLIDEILPAREVHVLGGPSGSNKTRWVLQTFHEQWSQGLPIFGHASHPVPYLYASLDRSLESVHRTLEDLGIDALKIPIFPARDLEPSGGYSIDWLFKQARTLKPDVRLLIIEAIGTLVPNGKVNDYDPVAKFLRGLGRRCKREDMTILGIHHTTKVKGPDGYGNPREKLLGSAAWGGYSETMFVMDFLKSDDQQNPYRRLTVLPRTRTGNFTVSYYLDKDKGGRLVEKKIIPETKSVGKRGRPRSDEVNLEIERFLNNLRAQGTKQFTSREADEFISSSICSPATFYRRMKDLEANGVIRNRTRGVYELVEKTEAQHEIDSVFFPTTTGSSGGNAADL